MAVADVFDALISKRVYKDAMSIEEAYRILQEDAGTHFDPELIFNSSAIFLLIFMLILISERFIAKNRTRKLEEFLVSDWKDLPI